MSERCVLVRPGEEAVGTTGVTYAAGVSAGTTRANASATEPALAVLARTDANEHESAIALPALDELPHLREEAIQ